MAAEGCKGTGRPRVRGWPGLLPAGFFAPLRPPFALRIRSRLAPVFRAMLLRPVVSVVFLLAMVPSPGLAGGVLHLTWVQCAGAPGATSTFTSTCDAEFGNQDLVASFVPDEAVDSVFALEMVIDARLEGASIPAWWAVGVPRVQGGCVGALVAAAARRVVRGLVEPRSDTGVSVPDGGNVAGRRTSSGWPWLSRFPETSPPAGWRPERDISRLVCASTTRARRRARDVALPPVSCSIRFI